MKKIRILVSDTFDPAFNLATEDYIFRDMNPDEPVLFLWRNEKTVVIGRFQNPWTECHTQKMEEDGITLVRRQSGGGAVYHDLGNTNFTFMSSRATYDKEANSKLIIEALSYFGVTALTSGRNDILATTSDGDKKISGSAFKETKDRCFHHGTLLIDADLSKLANYLNPHQKKLVSKGITSVRARVINLVEINPTITHETLSEKIIELFQQFHQTNAVVEHLSRHELEKSPQMMEYFKKYSDWQWRFGETPQFNHQMTERFSWGLMEVHLDVHKAEVVDCQIFSDSLHPEMIEEIMATLKNTPYNKLSFTQALDGLAKSFPMYADYLNEFSAWLSEEIR